MGNTILSVKEAVEKLNTPRATFLRKVKTLNIPKINRAGRTYFEEDILEQFFPSKSKGFGKVISFANQKGGIGKSTTCLNLAIALSKLNYKLLVLDFDPQANLSGQFVENPEELKNTIPNLLDLKIHGFHNASIEDTLIETKYFNLLPSNIALANFEASRDLMDYERLQEFLKTQRGGYDFILIDCPPTLDIKLLNALVCSDYVLIPNTPSKFSVQGLAFLQNTIEKAKMKNPTIKAFSIINQYAPKLQISALVERIEDYFPVLKTKIPRATDIEKSQVLEEHLDTYSPKKFKHYTELAKEVIEICQK